MKLSNAAIIDRSVNIAELQQCANSANLNVRTATAALPDSRAERGNGLGGAAAPRLDKRTYFNQTLAHYRVILRDFGDGLCEVGWSVVTKPGSKKSARGKSKDRIENEDRSSRRASSEMRHKVLASKADHLLTLTYRDNQTDFQQTNDDLTRFIRLVRNKFPSWVYIAVPERQKRGAWHWHLAVVGRQDVNFLRASWLHCVGEGNIDVKPPKRGQNRRLALVKYLSKYLAKGFAEGHRELNRHRYRASQGIVVPEERFAISPHLNCSVGKYALDILRERASSVGYVWADTEMNIGWACSWG